MIPDVLHQIVAVKKQEVAAAKAAMSLANLQARVGDVEDLPRGFTRALRSANESGWTALITEVKKGSPSKGIIRADFDPLEIAETYQNHGATCLSVLIREQVALPLLRKDFICDPYQIVEARVYGADAVLLIAAMLSVGQLQEFSGLAGELGLDVLLEVHNEKEVAAALQTDCELIGINNRDLKTFTTDIGTTARLARLIPKERLIVAESGIHSRADIEALAQAGAGAFLIGESLMREADIGAKMQELTG
jgi:indole-3-glycerol phosphate synthase